jgi:hypothetical protein
MEKTFQLEQREAAQLGQFDQARTQALAMYGALSLDMEQAKKNLEAASEQQRAFIRLALANRGVERYENARVQSGSLLVTVPDEQPMAAPPEEAPKAVPARRNGPPTANVKE